MNKPRFTLSRKLSLGILLMAVPIFIASLGVFFYYSRNLLHDTVTEHANSILNTTMQNVVNYMGVVANAANTNEWLLEENFNPDSLQAITQRIVTLNRSVVSCSVGTEPGMFPQYGQFISVYTVNDGDTIYTVRESDYDYYNKLWYKTARSTGKACWINPFSDYAEATLDHDDAVASYSLPLRTGDGRIAGIMATDFSFTRLAKIMNAIEPPYPSAYYVLLGGDGRYLIHPDANLVFKKTVFSENDAHNNVNLIALGHEMTAGKSGTMHVTIDGVNCHICYSPVQGTDWSLALVIPADEMMGPYYYLFYVVIALIIVGLLFTSWFCYRVVHKTIKPINELISMTDKIAEGEYAEVIPTSDRKDAVAMLQNSFAAMQQAIKTKMENIEETAQEIGKYNVEQEDDLKKAEEAISRKDQFLASVQEQMRRPMNVIKENVKMLMDNPDIPKKEMAAIADVINYNTNVLTRNVNMLFDSSDMQATNENLYNRDNEVSCNDVARDGYNYIREHFPDSNFNLETEVPDSFHIVTNFTFLTRTVRELLYNAAKYSDGQHILLRVMQTPTTARFIIQDVGPGLPVDSLDLIFKPFKKIDNLSEGLGLGLPLCKRHIERLGGSLVYDEDYKEGCRFIIDVPK